MLSEAGVMPSEELLTKIDKYTKSWSGPASCSRATGSIPAARVCGFVSPGQRDRHRRRRCGERRHFDAEPRVVEEPPDLAKALHKHRVARAAFDGLPFGLKRKPRRPENVASPSWSKRCGRAPDHGAVRFTRRSSWRLTRTFPLDQPRPRTSLHCGSC